MASVQMAELRALANIVEDLDYYQLLEVEPRATAVEVRTAYHAIARRFHPDRLRQHGSEAVQTAERVAKRVSEAYAVLRDPRRRKLYDQQRGDGERRLRQRELVQRLRFAERWLRCDGLGQGHVHGDGRMRPDGEHYRHLHHR